MGDPYRAGALEFTQAEINKALESASPAVRRAARRIFADGVESSASVVTFCSYIDADLVD